MPAANLRPAGPLLAILLLAGSVLGGCSQHVPFDSADYLRQQYQKQVGQLDAVVIDVPFELRGEVKEIVDAKLKPVGDDRSRVSRILDYVFTGIDLQ